MTTEVLILVVSFVVMLMMNVPIAVAIGLSAFLTVFALGDIPASYIMAQRVAQGISSFTLLAIPFFVLSGYLMGAGGMARRLIDFAAALVGRFPGGLAYVNTLTCMFFGAISGSAAAAVSSIGGFMMPEMTRKGYALPFNVAVTITSATTGLLIPPSNVMIVYAVAVGNISIASLFMAGILPGVVVGLAIMVAGGIISVRRGYGSGERSSLLQILVAFRKAVLSLLLIVIVLGGILGGIFSATEASAIAVAYAFLIGVVVYREVKVSDIPRLLLQAGKTTSIVMLLVGTSQAMSWIMAYENIPQTVSAALLSVSENKVVILLIMNLVLLFVGTFMDMTPAVLIFTPILLPAALKIGIHPVHFGMIMVTNLCIGLCTPPVGTCLFLGCSVGKTTVSKVTGTLIPFFIAMIAALMVITYVPALSLAIPRWLGLE
jgi:tripartite ATP-independent transporter DctM subunit